MRAPLDRVLRASTPNPLCYTLQFADKLPLTQDIRSAHASFQGICGLPGPRSDQEIDSRQGYRNLLCTESHGACSCRSARRAHPGGSHQRRSSGHPRSLFRRDEQNRRQLSGNVPQGENGAGAQVQGGAVRLSRDKVNVLARAVADALKQVDEVDFIEDPNTIRQETRRILEELLNQEARIDQAARLKIESQKRTILEGSQEWDILYRKYYNEEVKKLGV